MIGERLSAAPSNFSRGGRYFGSAGDTLTCRAVVLHGAGRAFCAGVDIKETTSHRCEGAVAAQLGTLPIPRTQELTCVVGVPTGSGAMERWRRPLAYKKSDR